MKYKLLISAIEKHGFDYIFYLPCSSMKEVINHFSKSDKVSLIPINREEEGIGLITGVYLSGSKPLLLIQDSGLGNSYNAIVSLLRLYNIGVPIIATIRGYIGEISTPNTFWADNTSGVNTSIGIKEYVLDNHLIYDYWENILLGAFYDSKVNHRPVIIKINLAKEDAFNV